MVTNTVVAISDFGTLTEHGESFVRLSPLSAELS